MAPSSRLSGPNHIITIRVRLMTIIAARDMPRPFSRQLMLISMAGAPSTRSTLAMFDPTTLPIAIPETPSKAACRETNSSGAEVPNATIVSPMINGSIDSFSARPTAPRTR